MDIDHPPQEELVTLSSLEEKVSQQAGSSEVAVNPPSFEEEKNSPAMGDEKITSGESPSHDVGPSEIDAEDSDPDSESSTVVSESENPPVIEEEEVEEENLPLTVDVIQTVETVDPLPHTKGAIVIEDRDDDNSTEEEDDYKEGDSDKKVLPGEQNEAGDDENKGGSEFVRPTKVVLRMLPPKLSNQDFIDSVSPLPPYDYAQVENPDPEWGPMAKSVAHINFLDPDDALWFIERFTGYQFIDDFGEGYFGIGDYAMSQKIFRIAPTKVNSDRGKLLESEDYIEFLRKYDENPFAFTMGVPLPDFATAEEMMLEIENRPKRKGPEPTPLTQSILDKKSRREAERQLRKERDRERRKLDRIRRDKDREIDRDVRKEKKRERRDKERKDKREREKLEKEAKLKGMTVTYSKSGKVTRWSANSGPTRKKEDDIKEKEVLPNSENKAKANTNTGKPSEKAPFATQKGKDDKPLPKPKLEESGFGKKPFSTRKFDKPQTSDKPKFGKPFPFKSETSTKSGSGANITENKKPQPDSAKPGSSNSMSADLPKKEDPFKKPIVSASGEKINDQTTQPKKKIIKKIIRVKKVRKPGEEGECDPSTSGGGGTKVISKTGGPSSNRRGSGNIHSHDSVKASSSTSITVSKTESVKKDTSSISKPDTNTNPVVVEGKTDNKDEKRRRARPDMQIYRPGSLRSSGAKDSNASGRPPQQRQRDLVAGAEATSTNSEAPKNPKTKPSDNGSKDAN